MFSDELTTMELSKEQLDFLNECEEEFQNRYTDADKDFLKVKLSTAINPPILDPWPCETQKAAHRNQRNSNRHPQRRDENSGGRYKEDRGQFRDRRRTKRKKRDRDDRERKNERNADGREKYDNGRTADRKRHKDHRRSEDKHRKRRRDSYRDEDRDRRYRRDNNHRDRRRNRDNYRERDKSRNRQGCREQEKKEQDAKEKVCGIKGLILQQDIWKHDLYENYRPYF